MKRSILFFQLFLFVFINSAVSQVTSVKYLMEYNDQTSLYDCKIVIDEGETTEYLDRIQFNSIYSVVVPTGAQVFVDTLYNPREFNQFYQGIIPCLWQMSGAELALPTQPLNDFHSIFPNLSPPSAYDDLKAGDTVSLFSLSIDVDPCEHFVRSFIVENV